MLPDHGDPTCTSDEIRFELRGHFADKVRIAETFQSAYDVLDQLCDSGVRSFQVIYHEDFEVEDALMTEFTRAAKEALAYKDALSFGRDIDTRVVGLERIVDGDTRAMASSLHRG